ncbi:hypothetical protein KM792_12690 [Clostridium tyrobutyricum]|jgi:uncharacterized protein (UPF0276 family)|uniref:hypothetical protein n=1 Tax=Clostridium tyrobutyricum TaxID=1519 RepID=UPI00057FB2E7|nr:hypothetical protein [Clostridium tyrobutyricum]MBR9648315.1 hypothetical protein [Clostridium tyrobutyricum]MBV4414949.1 hypothetical protein [Clostridium tyrobutyricum]MBV4421220.1 hypothetical protein [Clostridium tyrobutyricum]MBV4428603.1 hypothetical protein [Clostridium tyrobutyricum]MBV4431157.1 hypothetical protein [Clostridium tyrobutyricum]
MKGEVYNLDDIIRIENGSKVWIESKYRKSDLFIINKKNYNNINFIIDKYLSKWFNICLNYKQLETKINMGEIKIYEWLSDDEYLVRNIERLRNNIEVDLILQNKDEFIKETAKYNKLIKELEKRKLINY